MQEIKTLMLRVGSVANMDEYVFDGTMTDAHIQGYLNRGFKLHTMFPGAVDQSTSSVSVMVVLIREESQEQEVTEAKKWDETLQLESVPV